VLHAAAMGELNIFINVILRYIDVGGLHAPVIGQLNIFISYILRYSILGRLDAPVRFTHSFKGVTLTSLRYFFPHVTGILSTYHLNRNI
jgi:hypothetical protein